MSLKATTESSLLVWTQFLDYTVRLTTFDALSYWRKIQVTTKNFATATTYKLQDTIPIPL